MISTPAASGDRGDEPSAFDHWNQLPEAEAVAHLLTCCGSRSWAEALAAQRPFASPQALFAAAEQLWFALPERDWLEAFAAHPRIGERSPAATEYLQHSGQEQSAAQQTLEPVAAGLLAGNRAYEARFGFRYIVFASGRSAPELLAILESRLTRRRNDELHEAARQQHRITTLRMTKWLHPEKT